MFSGRSSVRPEGLVGDPLPEVTHVQGNVLSGALSSSKLLLLTFEESI